MGDDTSFDQHILAAHYPHPDQAQTSGFTYRVPVVIPDVNCPYCSLQVLSVMTGDMSSGLCCQYPPFNGSVAPCIATYHTCADITINGTGTTLPVSSGPTDTMNTWAWGESYNDAWTQVRVC
jgi:hypothetical protein